MFLRYAAATAVLVSGVVLAGATLLDNPTAAAPGPFRPRVAVPGESAPPVALALAPLSLGNLTAAAPPTFRLPDRATPLPAEPIAPPPVTQTIELAAGDTLAGALIGAGIGGEDATLAANAFGTAFDARKLRVGQEVVVTWEPVDEPLDAPARLVGLALRVSHDLSVIVRRRDDGTFRAGTSAHALDTAPVLAGGDIRSSLYEDGRRAGMPPAILVEVIRALSWDVDFQRDIRPDDSFAVLYERVTDEDGAVVGAGRVMAVRLVLSGKQLPIYAYETEGGQRDYFDPQGRSVRKSLLRTPVDGARLSSGFGARRHPILGFTRMHRGVDFAAPAGTPVYAAGSGVVEMAGDNGAYGNYIRIRHRDGHATAYAHLSRIASGVRAGARIQQGAVIGNVGSTGLSTGAHLHYEVLVGGNQVNPMSVKLLGGETLAGKELVRFRAMRSEIDRTMEAGLTAFRYASSTP